MNDKLLRALPFQVIEYPGGVLLKRGVNQISISVENALEMVLIILTATSGRSSSQTNIVNQFPLPFRDQVQRLTDELIRKNFLVTNIEGESVIDEDNFDVFHWQMGKDTVTAIAKIVDQKVSIIGVNSLSLKIKDGLREMGVENVTLVDDPLLREMTSQMTAISIEEWKNSYAKECKTVLATIPYGGQALLLRWNQFCVENNIHFLPVFLQDMVGYIGPLVIPRETACLECLRTRQNSHLINAPLARMAEDHACEGQSIASIHPAMLNVLAGMAVLELSHFYSDFAKPRIGALIKMNFLNGLFETKVVLKIPRCSTCSEFQTTAEIKKVKLTQMDLGS